MLPLLPSCWQKLGQKVVTWQALERDVLLQVVLLVQQCGGDLEPMLLSQIGLLGALIDRGPNADSMVVKALQVGGRGGAGLCVCVGGLCVCVHARVCVCVGMCV